MTSQDEYAARAKALLQVVAAPAVGDTSTLGMPDGIAQMSWVNFDGLAKIIEIVSWRRIDQGLLRVGDEFDVHVQARQYRDLRLPLASATVRCALTLDPVDVSLVVVGDTQRESGWHYGVRVMGAKVLGATGN